MTSFMAWLCGLKAFPAGELQKFRLSFLFVPEGYGILIMFLFGIIATIFAWWVYYKRRNILKKKRWFLMLLRVLSLSLLFFLLLGPVLEVVFHDILQSKLIFLIDDSLSMGIVDKRIAPEVIRRNGIALGHNELKDLSKPLTEEIKKEVLAADRMTILKAVMGDEKQGVVQAFLDQFDVKLYSFAKTIVPGSSKPDQVFEWIKGHEADGTETRIGTALETVLEENRGQTVAGVVVLTDGSDNGGNDPGPVLEKAGERGVPVYFIGIGEPDVRDVQVSFVAMRDTMFMDDPTPISIKLRHQGCQGQTVSLVVSDDDGEIERKEVLLGEVGEQNETIDIKPQRKGKFTYTVHVEPLEDELIVENNTKSKDIQVIDQKIKVLWIENQPRWEYRYAKNMMQRDTVRFDLNVLLFEADPELKKDSTVYLEEFPQKEEDLFDYHVVVIGDISSAFISNDEIERIKTYVSEKSGALIFLAGSVYGPSEWLDTPLEDILPVNVSDQKIKLNPDDEINNPITVPIRAKRTEIGKRHPMIMIGDDSDLLSDMWEKYLVMYSPVPVERAKPGAQILLETDEDEPLPIIVSSRYGSGTVFYIGTDEMWRWRYRPGPMTHDRFWGVMFQQLTLARLTGESRRINLYLSRKELGIGEDLFVTAQVMGEAYQPAVDEAIDIDVHHQTEDGMAENYTISLKTTGKGTGVYEGTFREGSAGRYTMSLKYAGEKTSAGFRRTISRVEYENPALDRNRLMNWARLTGGNVYDPWDLDELPKEISAKATTAVIRFEDELWDAPLWILMFIILAGCEWYIRKRENLP